MRTGVLSLIFAVLALGCIASSAEARPSGRGDGPSLDRILPQIREQHPGTFYDADGPFTGPDGRQHYRVKWMTPEGRVIWFNADSHTGHVVRGNFGGNFDRPRGGDPYSGPDRAARDDDVDRGHRRRSHFNDAFDGNPFGGGESRGDEPRRGEPRGNGGWRGHGGGYGGNGNGNGHQGHHH